MIYSYTEDGLKESYNMLNISDLTNRIITKYGQLGDATRLTTSTMTSIFPQPDIKRLTFGPWPTPFRHYTLLEPEFPFRDRCR